MTNADSVFDDVGNLQQAKKLLATRMASFVEQFTEEALRLDLDTWEAAVDDTNSVMLTFKLTNRKAGRDGDKFATCPETFICKKVIKADKPERFLFDECPVNSALECEKLANEGQVHQAIFWAKAVGQDSRLRFELESDDFAESDLNEYRLTYGDDNLLRLQLTSLRANRPYLSELVKEVILDVIREGEKMSEKGYAHDRRLEV